MESRIRTEFTVLPAVTLLAVGIPVLGFIARVEAQSSASYQMTHSVTSGGGGRSISASYELTATLGQPSPVDVSDSTSFNLVSGFWGAPALAFTVAIERITCSPTEGVRLTWHSIAGASYTVYFTEDLRDDWTALSSVTGTGSLMEWLDDGGETGTPPAAATERFYRLSGVPPSPPGR